MLIMKYLQSAILPLLFSLLIFSACNKSSPFGSEYVEDSKLNVKLVDTIPLRTYTVTDDSVLVFTPGRVPSRFFCGMFNDPVFGKSTAYLYTKFQFVEEATFKGNIVDSVILQLPYNADGRYGNMNETYGFEVYRVTEEMDDKKRYYSNKSFQTGDKVGDISLVPAPTDSVTVNAPLDTVKMVPHMRINVTDLWADYNDLDTNIFLDDSLFLDHFKGLKIVPVTENNGMLSFDLATEIAGVKVYYHVAGTPKEAFYPLRRLRMSTFEHDYSGSVVEEYLNSGGADTVMFVQGMSGVDGIIEISPDPVLKNKVINKAELIVTVNDLPDDNIDLYPYCEQLILSHVTDTSYYVIKDVLIANKNHNIEHFFGGVADEMSTPVTYKMNITNYFTRMLEGEVSNKLALTAYSPDGYPKASTNGRVVLGGAGNSTNAIKLRVIYTDY